MKLNMLLGGAICLIIMSAAIFAPFIAPYDPIMDANLMNSELPPSAEFWLGTDSQGRDVFSRILYGARVSLAVGIGAQLVNSAIGICLGVSAGYFGGAWDDLVSAATNLMLAIPSLVFALAIMSVLGTGVVSLLIALGLTNWAWSCRLARGATLSVRNQDYVRAAISLGYGNFRILLTQIAPNIIGPMLVIATLGMGEAILAEAALSFLGLGIRPPTPSLGNMLTDARELIVIAPWAAIFPGLAIFLCVLALNLFGDGLRDWLDPHMRRRSV